MQISSQNSSLCLPRASAIAPSSLARLHRTDPTRGVARGRAASCLALRVGPSAATQGIHLPLTQGVQEIGDAREMPGQHGEVFVVRGGGLKC